MTNNTMTNNERVRPAAAEGAPESVPAPTVSNEMSVSRSKQYGTTQPATSSQTRLWKTELPPLGNHEYEEQAEEQAMEPTVSHGKQALVRPPRPNASFDMSLSSLP